jgi:hypothetical protein
MTELAALDVCSGNLKFEIWNFGLSGAGFHQQWLR